MALLDALFRSSLTGLGLMVYTPLAGSVFVHFHYANNAEAYAASLVPSLQTEVRNLSALDYEVQRHWQSVFPKSKNAPDWYSVDETCDAINVPASASSMPQKMCSANEERVQQGLKVAELTRKVKAADANTLRFNIVEWMAIGFGALGIFPYMLTEHAIAKSNREAEAAKKPHPREH